MPDDIYNGQTPQNPWPGDPNDPMMQTPIPMPGFHWDPSRNAYVYTDPNGNTQQFGGGGSSAPSPTGAGTPTSPPSGGAVTPTTNPSPSFFGSARPKTFDDWLNLIATGYGIYGASRGNSFHQAPDPLTDAIRARIYGFIDNSPTRNMLGSALQTYMANSGGAMPMVPDKYGYNPYPNGAPKYDLSGLIPWIQSQTQQAPRGPQQPNGGGGGYRIDDPNNPILGMRM